MTQICQLGNVMKKDEKILKSILSYLPNESIVSLSQCSKEFKKLLIDSDEILINQLNSDVSISELIFKKENYFDSVNQGVVEQMCKKTDKIYTEFYHSNKKLVFIYFFSFLFCIDTFSLLLALKIQNILSEDRKNYVVWILFSPFSIVWVESIVVLILYHIRLKCIKKRVMTIVLENKSRIICPTKENLNKICKKLKLRTKYCKHNVFRNCLGGVIIFFIPLFLKLSVFREGKCSSFFLVSSSLFYIVTYISTLVKFVKKKCKRSKELKYNNLEYFNLNFPDNEKVKEINETVSKYRSPISEKCLNFCFFICKVIFGFLFVVYFSQIGAKIDDPVNGNSWITLFIPFYILYVPIIGYSILHCCSLVGVFGGKVVVIICTMFPSIFAFIANSIIIPMRLENRIGLSPYWIPGIFFFGTIFLVLHTIILVKKLDD